MSRPRPCTLCGLRPVLKKTVGYCHSCHPGGPVEPPPCRKCGSVGDYYSAGLCDRCHQYAPQPVGSCLDCHAWGVTRHRGWLCQACIGWRELNPTTGACRVCRSERHLGRGGYCRLCWRTASTAHTEARRGFGRAYIPLDVEALNRHGQQLFFAAFMDPRSRRTGSGPAGLDADMAGEAATSVQPHRSQARSRQLLLFDNNPPTWVTRHRIPPPRSPSLQRRLQRLASDIGEQRGWSRSSRRRVTTGIDALLGLQATPGAPIRATELQRLTELGLHAAALVKVVLVDAGVFIDDRPAAVEAWFHRLAAELPAPMRDEVAIWFDVLRRGSTTPPRYKPRSETTVRLKVRYAMPALRAFAEHGHRSLREVTDTDVLAVLPASGNERVLTGAALRSLFRVLKGRRVIFDNPIRRIATGAPERRQPVPVDVTTLHGLLDSPEPVTAAMAALLAFHGIRAGQLRRLQLTDIRDGRLHLDDGRALPVADPVRARLRTWLDDRARRWPRTINPHLFIHQRTAHDVSPVGTRWLALRMGVTASALRDDRMLDEAHATGGDVRRLVDLFGVTVKTASRYTRTVDHEDLRV